MSVLSSSFSRLLLASTIATLSACGGGDGGSSAPPGTTAGAQTGTLTDSAVAGVQYTTSAGFSGTTDAQGHFKYNPGETVTFKLGSLTLGTITATGTTATITPIELATAAGVTNQNKVSNLLVLLQSLDSDGDASNGITIPAAVATALTSTVATALDLTQASTTFASSGNSNLTGLISAAGSGATLVTTEEAQAHFKEAFFAKLAGTWHAASSTDPAEQLVFRFDENGNYFMGEVGATADEDGGPGIERGTIDWNPLNGITTANVSLDTSGTWGLSDPSGEFTLKLAFDGDTLVATITGPEPEVIRLTRVQPANTGIVGTWGVEDGNSFDTQQFVFLSNGKYFMLDSEGDNQGTSACGGPGIEYGSYSLANGTFSTSNILYDTNGCAGLHDTDDNVYASFSTSGLNNEAGIFALPPEVDEGVTYYTTLYRAGVAGPTTN